LCSVAVLRGYVGTDTYSYHLQYDLIISNEAYDLKLFLIEPAFIVIGKLVEFAGGDSFAYVSLIGVIQALLVIFILKRIERPDLFLMFYVSTFYLSFHFNIIRASTSLLLILISLLWVKKGGAKFYITLWSSVLFHYTAILIVLYILLYRRFSEKKYISGIVSILSLSAIIAYSLAIFGDEFIFVKYHEYINTSLRLEQETGVGFLFLLCLYLGLAVTLFKENSLEAIFFALPVILIKVFAINYPLLVRLECFILPVFILFLTKDVFKDSRRCIINIIIVVLCILNIYGVVSALPIDDRDLDFAHRASPYIPYHTLFDIK
jgi:hypothetical protein